MDKATKSLPVALHRAFLLSMGKARAVSVFRADLSTGAQFFFETTTPAQLVGHADAIERVPRGSLIRHLKRVAVVDARERPSNVSTLTHGTNADCPQVRDGSWTRCRGHMVEA